MAGRFKTQIFVIINKYDLNTDMSRTIISNLNGTGIKVYGKIPYDETMMFALLKGKAVNEFKPSGTAASELNRIWKTIKETVS